MLAFVIFSFILLISNYISLRVSALMGEKESNDWMVTYLTSFLTDFFMIDPFKGFLKLKIF